jgi:hypothetical protein
MLRELMGDQTPFAGIPADEFARGFLKCIERDRLVFRRDGRQCRRFTPSDRTIGQLEPYGDVRDMVEARCRYRERCRQWDIEGMGFDAGDGAQTQCSAHRPQTCCHTQTRAIVLDHLSRRTRGRITLTKFANLIVVLLDALILALNDLTYVGR